ncbi:MAG TPA: hypothetical protein VFE32_02725 [Puia sp.]|nr:hypothetical protein [Puia sp.]
MIYYFILQTLAAIQIRRSDWQGAIPGFTRWASMIDQATLDMQLNDFK